MAEEFQGGVCGGMWWNPPLNLFSSPCSVAELGGAYDMGSCSWPNELAKGKSYNQVCDSSLVFPLDHMDSNTLVTLGFGLSPTSSTTDWDQQNLLCKGGSNEENFNSLIQDHMNASLHYEIEANSSPTMMNTSNTTSQNGSSPMTMTASSNSSGDSSTITCEGGLSTSFPMNSSASYLIQSLFDDVDESQLIIPNNYGSMNSSSPSNEFMSSCSWVKSGTNDIPLIQQAQTSQFPLSNKFDGGVNMNSLVNGGQVSNGQYNTATTLSNIRASLLNSLQSRSRGPSFNQMSHSSLTKEIHQESKNLKKNDQPPTKRPRIEASSSLPTFKVRKEKLGDRITALQQLVSPFGKTDTASVLHEAIEYIKFLHDQVNALSTPYLKDGATVHHQQGLDKTNDNEEYNQDLRSRGLCLVPISSTYPVAQETPVDFWTPTFGGTSFR